MDRTSSQTSILLTVSLFALGTGFLALPEEYCNLIRTAVRDAAWPGMTISRMGFAWYQGSWSRSKQWLATQAELAVIKDQLNQELTRNNEYRTELAKLRKRLVECQTEAARKTIGTSTEPLFLPDLITARVIGSETISMNRGRKILAAGNSSGIVDDLLVVDAGHQTIDVGTDHQLSIHQPIFAGEIVIGCTATCGRFSSTLLPVTDSQFRGPAQLLVKTSDGVQPGPEGVVAGTGKSLCRLTGIGYREPVEVGDEVYTPHDDPQLPHAMYYGRVIRAELKDGAAHWEIDIEPAGKNVRLSTVQILKPQLNPLRVASRR